MKTYKSKINWWFIAILIAVFSFPIYLGIKANEIVPVIIFSALTLALFYWIYNLKYKIEGDVLSIYSTKININTITKIEKSNGLVSSPAISFDRIELLYNKFDTILLSPKNKQEFINELLKINPKIEVKI